MGKIRIYLSPSRQPRNLYAYGNTNEEKEMVTLAKCISSILDEEYECDVFLATLTLDIGSDGRPKEAKSKNCDIYLAIHSNAGGKGKAQGAVALYHPKRPDSKLLGEYLVMALNAICPYKSNRAQDLVDGMAAFQGKGYGEIRVPAKLGMTPVLMETNFHDHPGIAKWMVENKESIARAYVDALARFLQLKTKAEKAMIEEVKPVIKEVHERRGIKESHEMKEKGIGENREEDKLYRVQVGAFRKKENAEILKARLFNEGFDGFIHYS